MVIWYYISWPKISYVISILGCHRSISRLINQSFVGTPGLFLAPRAYSVRLTSKSGVKTLVVVVVLPLVNTGPPQTTLVTQRFPIMDIGFATPRSGNYLHILPSLNIYFQEDDDMSTNRTYLAAIEIGWLGFALWFARPGYWPRIQRQPPHNSKDNSNGSRSWDILRRPGH